MAEPVLLVVDDEEEALRAVEGELRDRYARHYRVEGFRSGREARARLEELAAAGGEVALVLAARRLDGVAGTELLAEAGRLHPTTRRALLIAWGEQGDPATGEAIFRAIARGHVDHYLLRPSPPADERFHHEVSGLLAEWWETHRESPHAVYVVGESWSGRAYELREALERCAMPHAFYLSDSEIGRKLVDEAGAGTALPMLKFPDGTFLMNPTNRDLAVASGSPVSPDRNEFDLLIVGAGPAGLSAAVYGASEGFDTLVVDEGGLGGQATASSSIRNYLGFPRGVSGRWLAQSAYQQAWVFGASFTFMQRVTALAREDDGALSVHLSDYGPVTARAVLLATGVAYRRLGIPALEALDGAGVYYGGSVSEAPAMAGRDVYVLGGANSAGQAALHLARYARRVTVVLRADALQASMSHYLVQQVVAAPNVEIRPHTEVVGGGGDARLERLVLRDRVDGSEEIVPADALFLMIGARPHTGWLPPEIRRDAHGFVLTGPDVAGDDWPLARDPFLLETSLPGVFAVGDVRHGSVKRVASAVGEGSVAIQLLHQLFSFDQRDRLDDRARPRKVG